MPTKGWSHGADPADGPGPPERRRSRLARPLLTPPVTTIRPRAVAGGEHEVSTAAAEVSVADAADRSWPYERDPRRAVGLLGDRDRGVLVGAWAVAPLAGEWIHQAALAIRARIPISVLLDQVAQYPTYSESYLVALEQLGP